MNPSEPIVGHIAGVPLGSAFRNRQALRDARIHRPLQAGIDGNRDGAYSIVVSGGYVDDKDLGHEIIYTGQGGNDPATKRQVADQECTRGNAALRLNQERGLPVRVARGHKGAPPHAPEAGYRYDGVFLVERSWDETGADGFRICRFHLVEANHLVPTADREAAPWALSAPPAGGGDVGEPARAQALTPASPAIASSPATRLVRPGAGQDWILDLVTSPLFQSQRDAVGKRLTAGRAQAVLSWLDANAGELPHHDLAAAIEIPEARLGGLIAALSRCLNLDGYPVLEDHGTRIVLDARLARTQFGLT